MKISLYQMVPELDHNNLMFRPLSEFEAMCADGYPSDQYEKVFEGDVDAECLEDVFCLFNQDHRPNYAGRSLSVSDVVEIICSPYDSKFYFCDTVGFSEIPFEKEQAMEYITNHDFAREDAAHSGNLNIAFVQDGTLKWVRCIKAALSRCRLEKNQLGYQLLFWPTGESKPFAYRFDTRPKVFLTEAPLCGHSFEEAEKKCADTHTAYRYL